MNRHTALLAISAALISSFVAVPVAGAAAGAAPDETDPIRTEFIVWLDDDLGDEGSDVGGDDNVLETATVDIEQIAEQHGVVVLDTLVASQGIFLLGSTADLDEGAIKKLFDKDERIKYAEPNYEGGSADGNRFHAWPMGTPLPSDHVDESTLLGLDLTAVHDRATGAGVAVAILDTGIDVDHELLRDRVTTGWDYIDDDANADDEAAGLDRDHDGLVDEAWGHGTHIAGIIAQIAPDAQLLSYRVLDSEGSGRVFAVAAAVFDAVDRGADVINLSFGLDHRSRSKMLKDAMKYAKKAGVTVVAAAGNEADAHEQFPAAEKDVISVTAMDSSSNALATFANHGDWVDVAAPGVAVMSTLPNGQVGTWSGSSMAAPFVTAQAALLIEYATKHDAKHDAKHVAKAILKSSRKMEMGKDFKLKYGSVDITSSLDEID